MMSDVKRTVATVPTRELSPADALAIGTLVAKVWPKPGVTPEVRAERLRVDRGDPAAVDTLASRSLVIREAGRVLAHALVFPRVVGTTAGDMTIAALAQVCSDPDYRGCGLGEAIARAAFTPVDDGQVRFSLFQTSPHVASFYERLGARRVENRIVDSTADDPEACPFWDEVIMRYPGDRAGWPEGVIDLRGPGY